MLKIKLQNNQINYYNALFGVIFFISLLILIFTVIFLLIPLLNLSIFSRLFLGIIILIIIFVPATIISKILYKDEINHNFKIIAKILNSHIVHSFFTVYVEGYYKLRRIRCTVNYTFYYKYSWIFRENRVMFYGQIFIEPKQEKRKLAIYFKKSLFYIFLPPQPTKNTYFFNNKIWLRTPFIPCTQYFSDQLKFTEQDILNTFFEQLTSAAEIVERNPDKFY